jgi:hypothetical protein
MTNNTFSATGLALLKILLYDVANERILSYVIVFETKKRLNASNWVAK